MENIDKRISCSLVTGSVIVTAVTGTVCYIVQEKP